MRNPLPFDTHAFVKRLTAAGVSEAQAEVHAETLADLVLSQLVNKEDLRLAKEELRHELTDLRRELEEQRRETTQQFALQKAEFNQRLDNLELRLTIRVGVIVTAGIGILTAHQRFLPLHP
jgi:hypothetical protein